MITHVELPMQTEEGVEFVSWPMALPYDLAKALIGADYRDHLGSADDEYWHVMLLHFGVQKPQARESIGIQLWGDEGQIFENEQYMALQWASENSPFHKDSKRSRFLMALLPVSKYVLHSKNNVTLQCAVEAICKSFNFWRERPIQGLSGQVTQIKGDWKYIGQLLNLKRKADTNKCCLYCEGTKGMDVPITDITASALWRRLVPVCPWRAEPSIVKLDGFSMSLVTPDIMHAFYLGSGRDLVASALVILLRAGHIPGNNVSVSGCWCRVACNAFWNLLSLKHIINDAKVKVRLLEASRLIKSWSNQHSDLKMPKQWKLTSKRLSLKGGKFTHFIGKAWQTKVILNFLVDYTEGLAVDPLLKTVLWAAQNLFGLLSESRTRLLFLLPAEIAQVEAVGKVFLETYLRLRVKYNGWCIYKLFNVRPKLHMVTDVVRVRNPVAASGWMDEDFIKRVMRIARKTHIATTHSSALKRYLTGQGCPSNFEYQISES